MGRFFILSECGDGVGLALRLKAEGHSTKIKIFDSDSDSHGQGIVDAAEEYSYGDTIIADCTGFGPLIDKFRREGEWPLYTFGGSSFADRLEKDRQFAEEVFRQTGVATPKSVRVTSWDDAAERVRELGGKSENGRIVLKPEGALSGVVPSYVAHDVEDALSFLELHRKDLSQGEVSLIIQEFIEGVALSTEGWFNGREWIEGMFNHTIERKQFLNDDLGPSGGCTGNVVWACTPDDPVVTQTLTKLTDTLRKHDYVGPLDVNCVVNKEGVYALEFTPRFGFDAFPTLLYTLCDFDFGNFIDDLARGLDSRESLTPGFGAGVRLTLPPWPLKNYKYTGGVPIRGFSEADKQWFYPLGVQLVDEELKSAPGDGIIGVVNGHGDTIGEAFARCYDVISRLRISDLQYRTDLAEVCLKDFRELASLEGESEGWIGVDLDGTLAHYSGWSDEIGEPIGPMVAKVKRWIAEGKEVRILTARGNFGSMSERYAQLLKIYDWLKENIGEPIEVTCEKDPAMLKLYDDRVVQIAFNEGVNA
jgi:phosphoribosylamine---glycine ligase